MDLYPESFCRYLWHVIDQKMAVQIFHLLRIQRRQLLEKVDLYFQQQARIMVIDPDFSICPGR